MNLSVFEKVISNKVSLIATSDDPAHDFLHYKRVVQSAKNFCTLEKAQMEVVLPAAWLHDFVIIPKNDPRRKEASRLSALAAIQFLKEINYPEIYFKDIAHAIEAHSFSAGIEPLTIEAKIVQDADRLDALGAIGIARCFATAGLMKRSFYSEVDPFCLDRAPDDNQFTVDHFYKKLFFVAENLKTDTGRLEGVQRISIMKKFLSDLSLEV
jgi:uncharacterized protein